MDKRSYTMKQLYTFYDKFTAPSFEITIDREKLYASHLHIPNLEVDLHADGTASGCTFSVEGLYDPEESDWVKGLAKSIKVGAPLAVAGGYTVRKELFYGCIDDFKLEFPQDDGPPRISVTGIDGMGILMDHQKPFYGGKKKAAEIVKELLNKSVSAGFARKVTVGQLTDFEVPLVKEGGSDWQFLNMLAARYGMTFFVCDGEMIFDNVASVTTPVVTLSLGGGMESFEKRVSIAHQVGKVEIMGRDAEQKKIIGAASKVTVGGSGKSAAQLVTALAQVTLREFSEFVRTQEECKRLAQARLNGIAMGLVSGKGRCIGLPELIPGRYIKIEGGDPRSNGSYMLTRVRHIFEEGGYSTEFEVKGAKT